MDWKTLLNKDRRRPSTNPGDHRAEFERDWDRTIFSTPVKRLQDKTQVFPLDPNDAVRTRLTHSLEVSSVARGLGMAVGKWLLDENIIERGMERAIEAIAATCGLVHDIGNPPFGHSGEDAIRYWFETRFKVVGGHQGKPPTDPLLAILGNREQLVSDFRNFEGNAQALRLLTKLQILADYYGLNLTYGTLSASCKYIAPSNGLSGDDHAYSKPGYFASEEDIVNEIRDKSGTGIARNPITFLVEAADDAVYSVADIEDAVKKRILTWKDVRDQLDSKSDDSIRTAIELGEKIVKAGAITIPVSLPSDVHASAFRTASIGVVVQAVIETFKQQYELIINGKYQRELIEDSSAKNLVKELKVIARQRAYATPPNLKLELMGRKVICDLMDVFWEGAEKLAINAPLKPKSFAGKSGALLSENYRRVFQHWVKEQNHLPETYHRLQLVTDYVAGMTDTFANNPADKMTRLVSAEFRV
jgi:dGTPase